MKSNPKWRPGKVFRDTEPFYGQANHKKTRSYQNSNIDSTKTAKKKKENRKKSVIILTSGEATVSNLNNLLKESGDDFCKKTTGNILMEF